MTADVSFAQQVYTQFKKASNLAQQNLTEYNNGERTEEQYNNFAQQSVFDATFDGVATQQGLYDEFMAEFELRKTKGESPDDILKEFSIETDGEGNCTKSEIADKAALTWFDENNNGSIDDDEQQKMDVYYANLLLATAQLEMFDVDGEAGLSIDEFKESQKDVDSDVAAEFEKYEGDIEALFEQLDGDKNNTIDDVELSAYFDTIDSSDGNLDGKYDFSKVAELEANLDAQIANDEAEVPSSEQAVSKADLPEGYKINDKGEILDANDKVIGKTEVKFEDVTNDGFADKITSYYLFG